MCSVLTSIKDADPRQQLPVLKQMADSKGVDLAGYMRATLQNTTIDANKAGRQWTYQYCTEFGWFQVPNPDQPMRSNRIGPDYWLPFCSEVFGKNMSEPNIQHYLDTYKGLDLNAKNLILVNNIEDPWQYAGMRKLKDPTGLQKNMRAVLIDCQDCGHCQELYNPDEIKDQLPLVLARQKIAAQVLAWLGIQETPQSFIQ